MLPAAQELWERKLLRSKSPEEKKNKEEKVIGKGAKIMRR